MMHCKGHFVTCSTIIILLLVAVTCCLYGHVQVYMRHVRMYAMRACVQCMCAMHAC